MVPKIVEYIFLLVRGISKKRALNRSTYIDVRYHGA